MGVGVGVGEGLGVEHVADSDPIIDEVLQDLATCSPEDGLGEGT